MTEADLKQAVAAARKAAVAAADSMTGSRWPGARVPLFVDKRVSKTTRDKLDAARSAIEAVCAVRFVDVNGGVDAVIVQSGSLCHSKVVGKAKWSGQGLTLGGTCRVGDVIHELMHVLGFWHEHQRPDRDEHVQVDETEVVRKLGTLDMINFVKLEQAALLPRHYDLESIMHYGPTERDPTHSTVFIRGVEGASLPDHAGQRDELSLGDIFLLKAAYG